MEAEGKYIMFKPTMFRCWAKNSMKPMTNIIGCLIGFLCGVLNTIPYTRQDPLPKRFLLKLIRVLVRAYVEIFRGV